SSRSPSCRPRARSARASRRSQTRRAAVRRHSPTARIRKASAPTSRCARVVARHSSEHHDARTAARVLESARDHFRGGGTVRANTNSGLYKTLLVLHILTAIVGLGAVMLNGIYASQAAKRGGPARRAVSEANFFVSSIGEYFIYA